MKTTETAEPAKTDKPQIGWGALSAVVIGVAIFFAAQFFGGFAIMLYGLLRGVSTNDLGRWLETSIFAQFFLVSIIELLTLWLLWLYLKRRHSSFKTLGLVRFRSKDILYAFGGFVVYLPLLIVVSSIVQRYAPRINLTQKQQLGFDTASGGVELTLVLVSLVILPALVEEILARGFLYTGLKRDLPKWMAVIITSLLFAAAHLQFGSGAPLLWVAAVDTFILSLVLIWLREKTGSLWPAIGLHLIKNSLAFVALFIIR